VRKAHRREKINKKDWKYAASRLGDEYYVHTCGVYGCASAHLFWARKAALLIRLLWAFIDDDDTLWMFIYVDDFLFLIHLSRFWPQATFLLFMLCIMGTPFSWQKMAAGLRLTWIGFLLDSKIGATGLDSPKRLELVQLLTTVAVDVLITKDRFKPIPHKLSWAATALEHFKPLLQPLFAFLNVFFKERMAIPGLVRLTIHFMITAITGAPLHQSVEFQRRLPGSGGTDASGQRTHRKCGIGGWFCLGPAYRGTAHWFMYAFDPSTLPWAFDRDEDSSRRISALELLGTAVYLKMVIHALQLGPHNGPVATKVVIPGVTDNQGNSHILARLYTKRWPGAAVLMEISQDLMSADLSVDVEFAGREDNTWSDALANGCATGFDGSRRYSPDLADPSYWHVLPVALRLGADMGMHLGTGSKRKKSYCAPSVVDLAAFSG
jgi:hypothetical protein